MNRTGLAAGNTREVGAPNLRPLFDCCHVQIFEGDVTRRLAALLPLVGDIQITRFPTGARRIMAT